MTLGLSSIIASALYSHVGCSLCRDLDGRKLPNGIIVRSDRSLAFRRSLEGWMDLDFKLSVLLGSDAQCIYCEMLRDGILHFRDHWEGIDGELRISIRASAEERFQSELLIYQVNNARGQLRIQSIYNSERYVFLVLQLNPGIVTPDRFALTAQQPYFRRLRLRTYEEVNKNPRSRALRVKIFKWLDTCVRQHDRCSNNTESILPKRLVYVPTRDHSVGIRLVDTTGRRGCYTTLSYCWGGKLNLSTTRSTKPLREEGILWTSLPQTFKDAIEVTRWLGVQYIWIDALCIVQDDPEDWNTQAGLMADIYENSFLTIAATQAPNGQYGFLRERSHVFTATSRDKSSQLHFSQKAHALLDGSDFSLIRKESAPLMERAWCFQERVLAARVLHFGETEILFECHEAVKCECGRYVEGPDFKLLYNLGHHQGAASGQSVLVGTPYMIETYTEFDRSERLWRSLVESFSKHKLTFETDTLPALAGIAGRLSSVFGAYLAGLWSRHIRNGLLWRSVNQADCTRTKGYIAPSFSWASRQGAIAWLEGETGHDRYTDIWLNRYCKFLHSGTVCTSPQNPFGAVKSGYLSAQALVTKATLRHQISSSGSAVPEDRPQLLLIPTPHSLDIEFEPLAVGIYIDTMEDGAFETSMNVSCMLFSVKGDVVSPNWARVLILVQDSNTEHFRRIGIAEYVDLSWFDGLKSQVVTVN